MHRVGHRTELVMALLAQGFGILIALAASCARTEPVAARPAMELHTVFAPAGALAQDAALPLDAAPPPPPPLVDAAPPPPPIPPRQQPDATVLPLPPRRP